MCEFYYNTLVILQTFYSLIYADILSVKFYITTNLENNVLGISSRWIRVLHNYNFHLKAQILLLAINPDSYFCK